MGLIAFAQRTKYRLDLRMALQKASIEELKITKEELKREFDRRRKQDAKK